MDITLLIYSSWEVDYLFNFASSVCYGEGNKLSFIDVGGDKNISVKIKEIAKELNFKLIKEPSKENTKEGSKKVSKEELQYTEEAKSKAEYEILKVQDKYDDIFEKVCSLSPDLLISGKHSANLLSGKQKVVVRSLFENAPCRMLTLRFEKDTVFSSPKVLLPTAGGPHAREGVRLLDKLARNNIETEVLYVENPIGALSKEVGERILSELIEKSALKNKELINKKVIVSSNIVKSIVNHSEDFDLVIIGSPCSGSVRQKLFGNVPDSVLNSGITSAVGVIREALPLSSKFKIYLERVLDLVVPQLSRDDRVALFTGVQKGAVWNFDFFTLISLSTLIATLGLIQNSVAVIIGAMLVAPLMTPLLGAGLAIVQTNTPLMNNSLKAVFYGFLVSLLISFLVAFLAAGESLTPEILARSEPTVIDMAVALASGVAAAYCLARPGLSSALAGIAIAAALVPPVASVGIALSLSMGEVARGAALLFSTNVVSIILGASLAFFGIGVRSGESQGASGEGIKPTSILLSILVVVAVALVMPFFALLVSGW